jgi:hypothetical protein
MNDAAVRVANSGEEEMAQSKDQIIAEIDAYIRKGGGAYRSWYVGIASDPRERLFSDHGVKEKSDYWIYREATSATVARAVEEYFLKVKGTDGGPGGGDSGTRFVYAYKKAYHTNP